MDYFTSSTFSNSDASGRASYYAIPYVPIAKFDGWRSVGGGSSGTFGGYLGAYNVEMQFYPDTSCLLSIFVDYDSTSRFLKVKARVTAVDLILMPRLRYALAEDYIPYSWGGGGAPVVNPTNHVVRKMLPNYAGVSFNINPGETFVDSQTYTLPSPGLPPNTWNDKNFNVVVFVQRDDTKFVMRSTKSGLFPTWVFGDANGDGIVEMADVIHLLNYLFLDGPIPDPPASGDPNYDCTINVGDIIYMLNYLFVDGAEPQKGCAW